MTALQKDMSRVQELAHQAYLSTGGILALLDTEPLEETRLASALDKTAAQMEASTVELRNLCEAHRPRVGLWYGKPSAPYLAVAGTARVTADGWLHIALNTLLPHCTRETPVWLTDTITRLLDSLEAGKARLPWFRRALLVLDEHCDVQNRQIYDNDNKGFKAVSNALKGRLLPDDDQFTMSVALLSTSSTLPACHIYVLPLADADDFFYLRGEGFPIK